MELSLEALVDESEPLGLLEAVAPVDAVNRNGRQTWRYRGIRHRTSRSRGSWPALRPGPAAGRPGRLLPDWGDRHLAAIDLAGENRRHQAFRRRAASAGRQPSPGSRPDHQSRLFELGEWVADHGIDGPGPSRAIRDLLLGRRRGRGSLTAIPFVRQGESDLEAACRMALALDSTVLAVQGPPGAGKTYTGARMITTLLAAGKKVGVAATSHKVIRTCSRPC